jgi:hypothetical protein
MPSCHGVEITSSAVLHIDDMVGEDMLPFQRLQHTSHDRVEHHTRE